MINKKGFTLIEMLSVLAIFSFIFLFFISVPIETMIKNENQENLQSELSDVVLVRQALQRDLLNESIVVSGNLVQIGENQYEFKEDSVWRNGVKLSNSKFSFNINQNKFTVINDRITLEYYIGSSLTRGEDI